MNKTEGRIVRQLDSVKFYKELEKYSKNPTFTTLISIVFAILLVVFAIKPSLNKATELKREIKKLENLDTKLSTKLSILEDLKPEYEKALKKKNQIYFCLPAEPMVETFERQVRYYIQKNNIPFKSLSISAFPIIDTDSEEIKKLANKSKRGRKAKDEEIIEELINFTPLSFSLSLEGDYATIKSFMYDFQKNIRASSVNSANINKNEDDVLRLSISGYFYYYQDKNL